MSKEEILALIEAELEGNIMILVDPKKKDSFSQARINVWKETVKERLYYYLFERADEDVSDWDVTLMDGLEDE